MNHATLKPEHLESLVGKLPDTIKLQLMLKGPSACVAGGFILSHLTGEPVNDVDIFTVDKATALAITEGLVLTKYGYVETPNAYTVTGAGKPAPQVIHRWTFKHPTDVIASFDFTVSSAAFWWEKETENCSGHWASACHPCFYHDMDAKQLHYTSPIRLEQTGGSLLRVLKFCKRGYGINGYSLSAVVARTIENIKAESLANIASENTLVTSLTKHLCAPGHGGSGN